MPRKHVTHDTHDSIIILIIIIIIIIIITIIYFTISKNYSTNLLFKLFVWAISQTPWYSIKLLKLLDLKFQEEM